jgi:UDPglucose 6-dehydrogenase
MAKVGWTARPSAAMCFCLMKIAIFGSGYVGLVAAAGFADAGHQVQCIDIDDDRIERLRKIEVPFFEPGLREVIHRAVRGQRLTFARELDEAHCSSELYFIAVGTPPLPDGRADTRAVHVAAETIASHAKVSATIGIKSTVPVGTGDIVQELVNGKASVKHYVASVPEFLKEGSAISDFLKPDRVILGVEHPEAEEALRELYSPLQLSSDRILVMRRRSSELSKYAANAMLATRISFMNELSRLCDTIGSDIHDIRRAVGSDSRIGRSFLYAGPGYGGSCFPKDVSALASFASEAGVKLDVVDATGQANKEQQAYVIERAKSLLPSMKGKVVAVWGLAFKPETDDVRESPALPLIRALLESGAEVRAHDPEAAANFARALDRDISYFDSEYEAAEGADLLVVMTEWRHLRSPDFERVEKALRTPNILDARNIWTAFDLNQRGFTYLGIGTAQGRLNESHVVKLPIGFSL